MKYPSVRQLEILTEQLRLMNALLRVSLRQHKPRASRTFAQVCKTHLHLSRKREKMRGYTREKMQHESEGGCDKRKKSHMWKKGHWKHVYSNSFSTGKTPSQKIVYSEPQNTVLKLLSARTERKSQAELQENKPTEYQVISTAFWFVSRMLCLVFISFSRLLSFVLVKTLISIYPSIYWIKAWHIYFSIISFTYIIPDESLEDLLHNQVLLKRSAPL